MSAHDQNEQKRDRFVTASTKRKVGKECDSGARDCRSTTFCLPPQPSLLSFFFPGFVSLGILPFPPSLSREVRMDECLSVSAPLSVVSSTVAGFLNANPNKYGDWSHVSGEEHSAITSKLRHLPEPKFGVAHVVSQLETDGQLVIASDEEAWMFLSSRAIVEASASKEDGSSLQVRQEAAAAVWRKMPSTWDDFLDNFDR